MQELGLDKTFLIQHLIISQEKSYLTPLFISILFVPDFLSRLRR